MFDIALNLDPDINIDEDSYMDRRVSGRIFKELEAYMEKDITEISACYYEEKKQLEETENEIYQKGDATLIDRYYQSISYFLYSMSYWEATLKKQFDFKKLLLFSKKKSFRRVLDFGGGVGGLVIFLNSYGISCDYLDVPGKTFDYAVWRFKQNRIENNTLSGIEYAPSRSYDAVFSWDVFEHLYNFGDILAQIHRILNNNGYCIFKASFSGGREHLKCNERYQDFNELYRLFIEKGFEYAGRIKPDPISNLLHRLFRCPFLLSVKLQNVKKYGGNFLVFYKK